eukprot:762981-Hanusia_phi.AAC.1
MTGEVAHPDRKEVKRQLRAQQGILRGLRLVEDSETLRHSYHPRDHVEGALVAHQVAGDHSYPAAADEEQVHDQHHVDSSNRPDEQGEREDGDRPAVVEQRGGGGSGVGGFDVAGHVPRGPAVGRAGSKLDRVAEQSLDGLVRVASSPSVFDEREDVRTFLEAGEGQAGVGRSEPEALPVGSRGARKRTHVC